jgi:Flp pilus assembly protein TadD
VTTFRIGLLLLVCVACSLAQDSPKEYADKAAEFAQRGDLKNAESELRKAVELSPDDPNLLTSLGGVLGMQGQLEQANVYLAQAVKLRPDEPVLRRNLAANEWQLGRFQRAQQDLQLLLHANPGDKAATFLLGMVSENEKNYTRSIALLESIPDVTERQPEAFVALASSYYHTGQRESGRSALQKLMNRSVSPQVLWMAGRVAMDARDYTLALKTLSQAARAMPDSYQVFIIMAEAQIKLRYFSQAVISAQKAVELHPSAETRRELAAAQWRAGNKTQARSEFESIRHEFPRDAGTSELYGTLLLEDGSSEDKSRAVGLLKQAIALDSSSVEARYQVANVEMADGQFQQALQDLERAIQLDPDDSRMHFALSRVYRRLGRNSDADRELELYQKLKAGQS